MIEQLEATSLFAYARGVAGRMIDGWRAWRDPGEREFQRLLRRRLRPWKTPGLVRMSFALAMLAGWAGASLIGYLGWRLWSTLPQYDLRAHWLLLERALPLTIAAATIGAPTVVTLLFAAMAGRAERFDLDATPHWSQRSARACAYWCAVAAVVAIAPLIVLFELSAMADRFTPQWWNPLAALGIALRRGAFSLLLLAASVALTRRLVLRLWTMGEVTLDGFFLLPLLGLYGVRATLLMD